MENKQTIMVTGNLGYIGLVLTEELKKKGYFVIGYDCDLYKGCELVQLKNSQDKQITKDIRDVDIEDLRGVDSIIHLAGMSNDPLGEFNPSITKEINLDSTLKLGNLAKKAGIKRFIYASSQSMYGVSNTDEELDEDTSEKNPITSYAQTKWEAELGLKSLGDETFTVVCFRPSTVFGVSPRLRCDIVYNNLLACAYTTGKIEILSDGTPWRPVVHVRDVSNAMISGLEAPVELVDRESFNVGIPDGNFTVRDLAEAASEAIPGCNVIYTGEHGGDSRTYRVSFEKILTVLKDYYKPEWNLKNGGIELVSFFNDISFTEELFRGKNCVRIASLKTSRENNYLDKNFRRI
jgi:nucleoside-diphosphate-sugar epimerase